jgi:hypothetical protein
MNDVVGYAYHTTPKYVASLSCCDEAFAEEIPNYLRTNEYRGYGPKRAYPGRRRSKPLSINSIDRPAHFLEEKMRASDGLMRPPLCSGSGSSLCSAESAQGVKKVRTSPVTVSSE